MEFKDKYTSTSEKDKIENKNKTVLSDDAYSISEAVDNLIKKIEHARMSLI